MMPRKPTADEAVQIADMLLAARLVAPYSGRAIEALNPHVVEGLGTIAVDKYWRLYIDLDALQQWSMSEVAWIIGGHEVEHLLKDHPARLEQLPVSQEIRNLAADLEINQPGTAEHLPQDGITPQSFGFPNGLLAEEYISLLLDQPQPRHSPLHGSGTGEEGEWELPAPEDGGPDGIDEASAEAIRDQVAADIKKQERQTPGSVPRHLVLWADQRAKKSTVPWPRLLNAAVARALRGTNQGRDDYSWSKPSRRQSDFLRPGMVGRPPRIALVVDVSGSMAEYGSAVIGHVLAACKAAPEVQLITCDAEVTGSQTIRNGKIPKNVWRGGGGTDLTIGIKAAKADLVLVVTDGETPWPDKLPGKKVVAVVLVKPSDDPPAWITSVKAY